MCSIDFTAVCRLNPRAQCLLYFTEVKANQSVGEKNGWDSPRTAEAVNSGFADLQHFGKLARGQILRSFILSLFGRMGFDRLRLLFLSLGSQLFLHRF